VRIRVGYQAQPQHADYAQMREAWLRAEDMGADVVFTWDHFYPLYGEPEGKHFEGWTLQAAMGEVLKTAEIGCLVTCNAYRNPELLADMARTVDHISGGRLIFGIGAGWFQKDFDEYGYEFGDAPYRLRLLRDALPRIERRLQRLNPPPTRDLPILIGGGGERVTLRLVARHADIWNGFGDPDQVRHKCQVIDGWCAKEGRDPAAIERSVTLGTVDAASRADEYVEAGATFLIANGGGPGYDMSALRKLVEWRDARQR
jgi:probable F420-dependent oxidoreductase